MERSEKMVLSHIFQIPEFCLRVTHHNNKAMSQSRAGGLQRIYCVQWRVDHELIGCISSGSCTERWLLRTLLFSGTISETFPYLGPFHSRTVGEVATVTC